MRRRLAGLALLASTFAGAARADVPPVQAERRAAPPPAEVAVVEALRAVQPALRACHLRALAVDWRRTTRLTARLDLGRGGQVHDVALQGEAVDAELRACLTEALRRVRVAGAAGGSAVEVPLVFVTSDQPPFVVNAQDARSYGPPRGKIATRILLDEANAGVTQAALLTLAISAGTRVAMHSHPASGELLYVLEGHPRLLAFGVAAQRLEPGDAVYVPAGTPHAVEVGGGHVGATLLQAFVGPGPERQLKDHAQAGGTVPARVAPASGAAPPAPVVGRVAESAPLAIAAGAGSARLLLERARTGFAGAYLGQLSLAAGARVPAHQHAGAAELLYVLEGRGELTIGEVKLDVGPGDAIHIPPDTAHAFVVGAQPVTAVQLYAPGGPEQRFKPPGGAAVPTPGGR